nr:cadherin-like beta sandwich domain-containing protein [Spirochaetota bacterium]
MKKSFFMLSLILLLYFIFSGCSQRSIKFDYQDTTDDIIENIQIETEPSDNCYLTDIIVSNVTFSSIFNKNTLLYIASVDYIVDKINLKIVKDDEKSSATIVAKFDGISDSSSDIKSNEYSPYIPLAFGENKITITVTAENNVDTKKYEIYVNRFNNNSQLSLLKLSEGILSGGNGVYSTTLSNNVDKISVMAAARDENSKIEIVAKFNGVEESADDLFQNVFSSDIALNIGENLVALYVTAPDNVTKSLYLIKITRNDKVKSPAFTPGTGSFSGSQNITITTETVGAKIRYTTNGAIPTKTYGIEIENGAEIVITESSTIKAIAYKEGLDDSEVVNATYIRLSSNNYLSSATFSSGYLSQAFDKNINDYSLIISNSVEKITFSAVTEDPASLMTITAKYDGVNEETKALSSNTDSDPINPIDITGDITIVVTAPDESKRSYQFGILRLNITGEVRFDPPGGAFSDSVTVTLISDTTAAKIRYTTDGTNPSRLNGTEIINGDGVTLSSSETIKAIAYIDGMDDSVVTEQSYIKLSDNADLSNIYFSEGAFDPFFNIDKIDYILTISNSVNSIYFSVSSVEQTSTIKAIVNIMGLFEETYDLESGKEYNLNNLSSIFQFRFEVTSPSGVVKKTYTVNPVWLDVVDEPSVLFNNRDPATEGTWIFAYSLTDGCKIRYTTDGSDPTRSYGAEILNNSTFLLVGSCQLKLIAYKDGMDDSQVVLYDYVQTSMSSYLSNIIISDNAIGIAFNKTTYTYNFDVLSGLSSLTFKPVLESPDASIQICAKF